MENDIEEIKNENNLNNRRIFAQIYLGINKIILVQILILILVTLFYFTIITNKKNEKIDLYFNNNINTDSNKNDRNSSMYTITDKIRLLKLFTNNDEREYKAMLECLLNDPDTKYCIYHLISPKLVLGKDRILLGEKSDGCYVLLNDFNNIKIAYSFGISTNIQFDKALADKGIDVYMYDHTINSLPFENPKFHWKKIGLCGKKTNITELKTLEEMINENGHNNEYNMILKMDIEHWEWESLNDLNEDILNKFKYIAIEYHFHDESEENNQNLYYNVLKKISNTHQAFYIRCNGDRSKRVNFGNNRICHILEVSYIIKKDNQFVKDETIYPMYEFDYSIPEAGKLETNLNILKLFDK